jgi:hypothetical protein
MAERGRLEETLNTHQLRVLIDPQGFTIPVSWHE